MIRIFLDSFDFIKFDRNNVEDIVNKVFEIRTVEIQNFENFFKQTENLNSVFKVFDGYNKSKIIYL